MNTENVRASSTPSSEQAQSDYAKLVSLLALATGAVAMPQTSNADVIFTDLSGAPPQVGPLSSPSFIINNLPGVAQIAFDAHTVSTVVSSSRWVVAGQEAGYVRFRTLNSFALANAAGKRWGTIAGNIYKSGTVGYANYGAHGPNSYDHLFLAFEFKDSTAGNQMRYGWIDVSLFNPAGGNGPNVTIYGYAYDTSGQQLGMGSVPEPSTAALAALALGAVGVRSWRRKRAAAQT